MAQEAEQSDYFDDMLNESDEHGGEGADMDAALEARMREDDRLESGVPADQRHDDIGFIQFSGITRPDLAPQAPLTPVEGELDPSRPVSFYEPGVKDVDGDLTPDGWEAGQGTSDEIIPPAPKKQPKEASRADSASAEALRHIIADLTGEEDSEEAVLDSVSESETSAASLPAEPEEDAVADMHVAPPTPTEEDYTPQDTQETIDLIASALAQPPASPAASPEPVQLSAPDPMDDAADTEADAPVPAAPEAPKVETADSAAAYDEETTSSAPVAADSEGLKERMAPRLSEAEQLMAALDAGRETTAEAPAPVSHEAAPETQPAEPDPAEDSYEDKAPIWSPEPVPPEVLDDDADAEPGMPQNQTLTEPRGTIQYSYSAAPSRRRSSKGGRKKRRAMRLLGFLAFIGMIAAGIGGVVYFIILPSMAPPENMFAEGQKHWQSEEYEAAATDFAMFAQRHPNHPDSADALFRAGLALQTAPAESRDARDRLNQEALTLYQQFLEANPVHPKAPRAETLIGVLMFELGDYEEAITFLRDPARRVKDPDAGLARLRTLGDAYSKLGNVEDAESTYLQAAVLPGNYTRDVDYTALGDLFSRHAEMTEDPEVREDYLGKAAEYWRLTLALPSASPQAKSEVETKLNLLSAINDEPASVTPEEVTEDLPDMTAPVQASEVTPIIEETPEPVSTETEEATSPAQSTVSVQEPDPTEEAAFLEGAS